MNTGHEFGFGAQALRSQRKKNVTNRKLGQIIRSSGSVVTPRSGTSEEKLRRDS